MVDSPPVASPPASVKELRNACAASGFHEHDGCSCSDEELIRRASSPPVASPPASVEEIAQRLANGTGSHESWLRTSIANAIRDDRAATAERVAGLERERDEARRDLGRLVGFSDTWPLVDAAQKRAEASEAEVARLREALDGMMRVFSPFPREDTEGYREEYEAYEIARAALTRPDEPTKET